MNKFLIVVIPCLLAVSVPGQVKAIHVFVALCDNEHQGIVPVPKTLGDGKNPGKNLYWGAAYGIKTYFDKKASDWELIDTVKSDNPHVLERILFKHIKHDVYMLADAYDGEEIKTCIEDFMKSANGQIPVSLFVDSRKIDFGGESDLVAYIGHDGLMDFDVSVNYVDTVKGTRDVIILACYSKLYFSSEIKKAKANPLLWTTHLMAPEAYTFKAVIDGWINEETGEVIKERAAREYNVYQKCGLSGARKLFTSGF
jgi:hypothetical protein